MTEAEEPSDKLVRPTLWEIRKAVSLAFDVKEDEIRSATRVRHVAEARQAMMLLAHEMSGRSLTAIGRFSSRDHTTIMHGISKMRRMIGQDYELQMRVALARHTVHRLVAHRPPVSELLS